MSTPELPLPSKDEIVSLEEMAMAVNNVNLDKEIIAFDSQSTFSDSRYFPLRLDALMIVLWKKGEGRLGIDLNEFELKPNTLIVIQPQNYIHLVDVAPESQASVLACSRRVVEHVIPKLTDLLPLMMHHRSAPVTYLTADEAEGLSNFHKFLKQKLQGAQTPFLKQKVFCILQAALFEMMDIAMSKEQLKGHPRTRKEEIMAKFILILGENFKTNRQVTFYADQLCITPKHLSAVVKEISGRTAGDWIESYVTMEAKVLLRTTDLSIQQIASKLNFSNQSFFGKYFRKQTGYSPSDFRRLEA